VARTADELGHRPARSPVAPSGKAGRAGTGPTPPGRRTTLSRRGVGVAVAATAALFAGVTLGSVLLAGMGSPGPGTPPAGVQVMGRTDAASVAFDAAGGWLADDHAGTVRHFDPSSGATVGRTLHLGGRPISVTAGFGRVWVADLSGSRVWEIDPTTGRTVGAPIAVPEGPVSVAAGDGGVWVASLLSGTVCVIDPRTGAVQASATLPDGAVRIAVGPAGVWVSGQTHSLTRVDERPDGTALRWRTVAVGRGPLGVGVGDGSVWVANVQSGTVSRVDPATVRVTATYSVGTAGGGVPANPETVAVWRGRVWVADGQQGEVVALDPATGHQVGAPVPLPGVIRQLALDDGGTLWGTTANPGRVLRFHS